MVTQRVQQLRRNGSGAGKGQPGGLRRGQNVGGCKTGGPGKGQGKGQGTGQNRKK